MSKVIENVVGEYELLHPDIYLKYHKGQIIGKKTISYFLMFKKVIDNIAKETLYRTPIGRLTIDELREKIKLANNRKGNRLFKDIQIHRKTGEVYFKPHIVFKRGDGTTYKQYFDSMEQLKFFVLYRKQNYVFDKNVLRKII